MAWGTNAARAPRRAASGDGHKARHLPPVIGRVEIPASTQVTQCGHCEVSVILAGGKLPKDWSLVDDPERGQLALCPDCLASSAPPAPTAADAGTAMALLPGCISVDLKVPRQRIYSGCRVVHWLVGGSAVIRINGGECAGQGKDVPVHFLAGPDELDHLIIHLANIRASLRGGSRG